MTFLAFVGVEVIDATDSSSEAADMAKNTFDDVRLDKLSESGRYASPDVVDNPRDF